MGDSPLIPPSPHYDINAEPPADDTEFFAQSAPGALFAEWLKAAHDKEPNDPNAMALATVDDSGMPDVRMVLLKDVDERGFVFYTNAESAKGAQLANAPSAALCFHWKSLRRQVRVRGAIELVSDEEADRYFATRNRGAQIGAWASAQSRPLAHRGALEKRIAEYGLKFGVGDVARPPHWRGYRLVALQIEFWRDRPFRLHDRLVFLREAPSSPWRKDRLYP